MTKGIFDKGSRKPAKMRKDENVRATFCEKPNGQTMKATSENLKS